MRKRYAFAIQLADDPDGGVLATFVEVPEAIAHGCNRESAIAQARQALAVALFGYLKEGWKIPGPKSGRGDRIGPHATDVMKIAVVEAWRDSEMSKSEFARLLGVDEKEARRILDPDAATKADRLEQALAALGRKVHVTVEAA